MSTNNNIPTWYNLPFLGITPKQTQPTQYSPYAVIGENEKTFTLQPNQTTPIQISFNPQTLISGTIYIENTQDIPLGDTTDSIKVSFVDWRNGLESHFNLTSYNYGKYIENYPIQYIYLTNSFPVSMTIYFQYSIKKYYEFYTPVIQDLTQLTLAPSIVTPQLEGGTNFRYTDSLAKLDFSNFPLGVTVYITNQYFASTSSTTTGSVTVPYTATFTENMPVGALGVASDQNIYPIVIDTTTQKLPDSATSTDATETFLQMDFFSPITVTFTAKTFDITYNSDTNTFGFADTFTVQTTATYFTTQDAIFCNYTYSEVF